MTEEQRAVDVEPRLVQTREGKAVEHRGHRSGRKRTVTVGREWEVYLGDELMGTISYDMQTRETRSEGRVYVNTRWESPGWAFRTAYRRGERTLGFPVTTKREAIQHLLGR